MERLSVNPSTRRPDDLKARLVAQDVQDSLLAPLKVQGGLAPEVVQNSDSYKYLFVGFTGPSDWRFDIVKGGLSGAKHILASPVTTSQDALYLSNLNCDASRSVAHGGEYCMMWNELRFGASILHLQQCLQSMLVDTDGNNNKDTLQLKIHLSPPFFGAPTLPERSNFSWWHMRSRGGGAMGVAGVQVFDLLQFLLTSDSSGLQAPSRVKHQVMEDGGGAGGGAATFQGPGCTTSGDACTLKCEYDELNVHVEVVLDWSLENTQSSTIDVYSKEATVASLNLVTGEFVNDQMVVAAGASTSIGGAYEDSQMHFVRALVEQQQESVDEYDLLRYGVEWKDTLLSYNSVDGCYRSWDEQMERGVGDDAAGWVEL